MDIFERRIIFKRHLYLFQSEYPSKNKDTIGSHLPATTEWMPDSFSAACRRQRVAATLILTDPTAWRICTVAWVSKNATLFLWYVNKDPPCTLCTSKRRKLNWVAGRGGAVARLRLKKLILLLFLQGNKNLLFF